MKRSAPLRRSPLKRDGRPLARRTPIRARSKKQEAVYRVRRRLVAELLAERPVCERCGAARSTDVHEPRMRSRRPDMDITDPRECVCLCRACHTWVHTHPAEATREGWLIPSWAELAECGVHPTTAACETCTACRKCGPCECELATEWAREAAWPG